MLSILLLLVSTGIYSSDSFLRQFRTNTLNNANQSELQLSLIDFVRQSSAKFPNFIFIINLNEAFNNHEIGTIISQESQVTFQVQTFDFSGTKYTKVEIILIFFVNFKQFSDFNKFIFSNHLSYFVMVFETISPMDIETVFKLLWLKKISNVNILLYPGNSPQMLTFMPFKHGKCHDMSPIVINEFTDGFWSSNNFFPEKFRNMHMCKIKANAMENAPIVIKTTFSNGSYVLDGVEITLIKEIAESLNFQIDIESSDTDHGLVFEENNTASGNIRHAISGDADMVLGSYYLRDNRAKFLSYTQVYRLDPTLVVGAQNPAFTPLEKLMRPFDFWLLVSLSVMLIMSFTSMFLMRYFKLCEGSEMQLINIVVVFLGGSQTSVPKSDPLRVLFITFAFFCIIIRTIYQGSLFTLMQTDDRTKGITSIDEMVERGFTFFVTGSFGQTTKEMKFHHRYEIMFNCD